jgi:hypothetical protein
MAVNCSKITLNGSWMAVVLPMNIDEHMLNVHNRTLWTLWTAAAVFRGHISVRNIDEHMLNVHNRNSKYFA